ncbi:hypothetical protein OBBRIDRAFT_746510 [Obba rivulosa]|uniref:Non-structural maintenance of chromosomes element 1 homolog n=1 Tax=Obba rivulosa TaxID=1052685 RepID=A0A8E2DSG9_9APHY|nr:hypothetical protein OBBRIDRAFT_746510 [Obba rivulosa]
MVSSNDVQRLFLQSMLSRRMVSYNLALKLWEKCVEAVRAADETLDVPFEGSRDSWNSFVTRLNDTLDPLNLELAHSHDESTGKEMFALVNRKDDAIAQMATDYTSVEIVYFKAVVEQIMLAPNESYCVSSLAALREVNSLKTNMTKAQAEVVLGSFVTRGWLLKSKKGRYSLSIRSLMELQDYLKNNYPEEIFECTICSEVITRGIRCYSPNCQSRMHHHCYNLYKAGKHVCPTCGTSWSGEVNVKKLKPIGEGAFREGQDLTRRQARHTPEEDEDDEAEEEYVEEEPSQLPQTQKKGKNNATASENMEVDDEEEDEASPPPRPQRSRRAR